MELITTAPWRHHFANPPPPKLSAAHAKVVGPAAPMRANIRTVRRRFPIIRPSLTAQEVGATTLWEGPFLVIILATVAVRERTVIGHNGIAPRLGQNRKTRPSPDPRAEWLRKEPVAHRQRRTVGIQDCTTGLIHLV
jgi:hypothetical protein